MTELFMALILVALIIILAILLKKGVVVVRRENITKEIPVEYRVKYHCRKCGKLSDDLAEAWVQPSDQEGNHTGRAYQSKIACPHCGDTFYILELKVLEIRRI